MKTGLHETDFGAAARKGLSLKVLLTDPLASLDALTGRLDQGTRSPGTDTKGVDMFLLYVGPLVLPSNHNRFCYVLYQVFHELGLDHTVLPANTHYLKRIQTLPDARLQLTSSLHFPK